MGLQGPPHAWIDGSRWNLTEYSWNLHGSVGSEWISHGSPWMSTDLRGSPQTSVDVHGSPGMSMELKGNSWRLHGYMDLRASTSMQDVHA